MLIDDLRPARRGGLGGEDLIRFRAGLRLASARQGPSERLLRAALRLGAGIAAWRLSVHRAGSGVGGQGFGAGHVVAVAPHRAWVEPFLLLAAWPKDGARLAWLADGRTVTGSGLRRRLLPRLGIIPIEGRIGGPRAYAELAVEALDAGMALVVFPEVGSPSTPERLRRISPGFAYIASRAGAPILPVVVGGTHRIVRGSFFSVDFLRTIEVGESATGPFDANLRRRAHELTAAYGEAVVAVLPGRTREADARSSGRQRWRWLSTLFN